MRFSRRKRKHHSTRRKSGDWLFGTTRHSRAIPTGTASGRKELIIIANPWHHAVSSQKRWGGTPEDYLEIHSWFDASKAHLADFRHRALRHHAEGIFECEEKFGVTITLSTCARCGRSIEEHRLMHMNCLAFKEKKIPTRWVGEQHVQEDLGTIPTLADWLTRIAAEPWMNRSRRLSRELDEEVKSSARS